MGTFDFDEVHYITEDHVKVEDGPIDVIGIFNFDITKYTVSIEDGSVNITKELPTPVAAENNRSIATWNMSMSMAMQCSRVVQKGVGHRMDNDQTLGVRKTGARRKTSQSEGMARTQTTGVSIQIMEHMVR